MQNPIKDFFTFTKGERQGLLTLSILILIAIGVPYVYRLFAPEDNEIASLIAALKTFENNITAGETASPETAELFFFNPNEASREELLMLGIPEKAVNSIINYREKGGRFYQRDDLLKIYSVSKEDYLRLRKYIKLNESFSYNAFTVRGKEAVYVDINRADSAELVKLSGIGPVYASRIVKYRERIGGFQQKEELKNVYGLDEALYNKIEKHIYLTATERKTENIDVQPEAKIKQLIDINSADSLQLLKVKGIGPVFSARIIKYRNLLGGFVSIDQLLEVYGIKSENFEAIAPQVIVELDRIRKLNINTATYYDLKSHPYINAALADFIISYRTKNNQFNTIEELRSSFLVDEDLYRKLAPYLEL